MRRSVTRAVRCNDKRFRKGPTAECTLAEPPPCAGSLVDDAVALGYGVNDPPASAVDARALRFQLTCQRRIGSAAVRYVGSKLRGLIRHEDPVKFEDRASRLLGKIPEQCLVTVATDFASGLWVPSVGGAAVRCRCRGVGKPGRWSVTA